VKNTWHVLFVFLFFLSSVQVVPAAENGGARPMILTYADAALILASSTGFFDRYVEKDACLNDCVAFLNEAGVRFGLMEVVNGKEFTQGDCARSMGQIELILSGEAEYVAGKVLLPKDVASWEDFCIMNGVDFIAGYKVMVQELEAGRRYAE
jgi:hypothetical protein